MHTSIKGTRSVRKYPLEEWEKNREEAQRLEKKEEKKEFNAFISIKTKKLLQRGQHVCIPFLKPFLVLNEC